MANVADGLDVVIARSFNCYVFLESQVPIYDDSKYFHFVSALRPGVVQFIYHTPVPRRIVTRSAPNPPIDTTQGLKKTHLTIQYG